MIKDVIICYNRLNNIVYITGNTMKIINLTEGNSLANLGNTNAVMVFTFARVTAAVSMKVKDYYPEGKRWWVRLHEKGGKRHEMPAHHTLEQYLDEYLDAAELRGNPNTPLFRTFKGRTGKMTENQMIQTYAWQMIQKRALLAGIRTKVCNHTFRGTGITTYLSNNGTLEKAQQMAAHESPRTTKLYDRTSDALSLDEIEKILI